MKNITQLIKNKILFALKNNKNDINKSDIIKNSLKYYFLLSKLNKKKINVVECGIGAGESLSYICKISKLLDIEANIWAFDSFEGFPKSTTEDEGKYKAGSIKPHYKLYNIKFVKNYMKTFDIEEDEIEKINFVKGFFPESFQNYNSDKIDFLHLDVDLYNSYKNCLEFFWQYLNKGSLVLFDEYKSKSDLYKWPGASRAIDEFFTKKNLDIKNIQQEKFFNKSFFEL